MTDLDTLYLLANEIAKRDHGFLVKKGPGKGDLASLRYMRKLNHAAKRRLGNRVRIEETVMAGAGLNFDYYLPKEGTAVEVALSLGNAASEYEKDLLKAILAKKHGKPIRKLVFLTKPRGMKVRNSPSSQAEQRLLKSFGIEVVLLQLRGRGRESSPE